MIKKQNEGQKIILPPDEGYFKMVFIGIITLISSLLVLVYLIYNTIIIDILIKNKSIGFDSLFLILIIIIAVVAIFNKLKYAGNEVIIKGNMISKPSLLNTVFKNVDKEFIYIKDIKNYNIKKIEGHHTKTKGIQIKLKNGKVVNYSEDSTPNCTKIIKNYLDNYGVERNSD